jgi:hypothetical protein
MNAQVSDAYKLCSLFRQNNKAPMLRCTTKLLLKKKIVVIFRLRNLATLDVKRFLCTFESE